MAKLSADGGGSGTHNVSAAASVVALPPVQRHPCQVIFMSGWLVAHALSLVPSFFFFFECEQSFAGVLNICVRVREFVYHPNGE
jgi:hypothetical protein